MSNILLAPCKAAYHIFRYFFYGLFLIPRKLFKKKEEKLVIDNRKKEDLGQRLDDFGESVIEKAETTKEKIEEKVPNKKIREPLKINYDSDDAKKSEKKQTYYYEVENSEGKELKGYFEA